MKRLMPFVLLLAAIILIIPALALGSIQKSDGQQPQSNPFIPFVNEDEDNSTLLRYRVLNHETGELMELSPFEYITGVVAAEMPISFNSEALSAQAVAAHTYALRQIDEELKNPTPELNGAFLTTDYHKHQAYISDAELQKRWGDDYAENKKKLNDAVRPVIDKVMTMDNKPIIAAFHSLSNGTTESAMNVWGQDIPYLTPVKSEGDSLSPKYETKTVLTAAEVESALLSAYPEIKLNTDKTDWLSVLSHTQSGTVEQVRAGDIEITGKRLRELLELKSASFTIEYNEGEFTFDTKGYGHGVGMSQYGADFLARQGKNYIQILEHYYKGIKIDTVSELNLND